MQSQSQPVNLPELVVPHPATQQASPCSGSLSGKQAILVFSSVSAARISWSNLIKHQSEFWLDPSDDCPYSGWLKKVVETSVYSFESLLEEERSPKVAKISAMPSQQCAAERTQFDLIMLPPHV